MVNKLSSINKEWITQTIRKVTKWGYQCWFHDNGTPNIFTNDGLQPQLNKLIEQAEAIFKNDRTTTVVKIDQSDQQVVLKRYNARNQLHKFKRAFRQSRASRCWHMSYRFQGAGLNVAEPVLMFEKRIGPIRQDAYFVNKYLSGEELLGLLPTMDKQQKQEVVVAINQAFAIMQTHKLSHGDMKASNLLWVNGELFFIDLDASRKHLTYFGWRLANKKDKKRFLKNWQNDSKIIALFSYFNNYR